MHKPLTLEGWQVWDLVQRLGGQPRDEVPWCAAFVGAVLARCGVQGSGSLLARSYERWGRAVRLEDARPGDVVVLARGKPWQGHVGFWDRRQGDKVYLLGGNQSNQVKRSAYPVSRIVALRRAIAPEALPKRRSTPSQSTTVGARFDGVRPHALRS